MLDTYYTDERSEILPHLPARLGDVLELGCAAGEHGALLLASGRARTVVGVDRYVPTDAAAQKLTRFYRADIGEWVKSSSEQFDTIMALDVLEHLVDPWTVLADCRRLLRPNGMVVASIPNIRFVPVLIDLVGRGRFDYRDGGVLDRTHLRFFTRRSIVAMFDSAGFGAHTVRRLTNPRRSPIRRLVALGLRDLGCKQFVIVGESSRDSEADAIPSSSWRSTGKGSPPVTSRRSA